MKKRIFSLILCLLIAICMASPAFAFVEYGRYYDETDVLWTQEIQTIGEETIPAMIDAYGFDIRIDVFTSIGPDGVDATAEYVYGRYGYGVGDNLDGVSVTVYMIADDTGWYVEDWCVYAFGTHERLQAVSEGLNTMLAGCFNDAAWNGDLQQDCLAMEQVVATASAGIALYAEGDAQEVADGEMVPAESIDFTAEGNVIDLAGVLSVQQDAALESMISAISNPYQCGCYVVVTDDLYAYGSDAPDAVINIYHDNVLGMGDDRDGILLMLDPVNRKFAFFVYGENAEYIFNAYGQEQLETVFLDDFGADLWYDGLEDFVAECGNYMELAAQGNPVSKDKTGYYGVAVVGALLISAIVCFVLLGQMKSVAKADDAVDYVSEGGLLVTERSDQFLYKTTTTRDLSNDDDDSGSSTSSFSGGGGSGRSGSF